MTRYCTTCGQETAAQAPNHYLCANQHHNYVDAAPAGIAYVLKGNQVLFGVRSTPPKPGSLNIPGGFLEIDETAEQATLREIKEELGINAELIDYLGTYVSQYPDGQRVLNIVYIARYMGGEITPGDDMNGGEPVWRSINDLPAADELSFDNWQLDAQKDLKAWYDNHKLV
ncbi:MAG TPA: NUDIX domain-containing protein [Candidatus Saccharimonadales bacterium]|nr:NUDIX domain-containing protein [Candidatus Saccharimonadales bacterium]